MESETISSVDVVIPVYNEEDNLERLVARLESMSKKREDVEFYYIFIDDGSRDNSFNILKEKAKESNKFKLISFSRNFGHQAAVTAGIDASTGEATVLIDADLQDPPELIIEMLLELESGYDIIYAQRASRAGESWHKKLTAKMFYYFFDKFTTINIPRDTGDFRIMRRNVVVELQRMPEKHRFIRGMVAWCGFRSKAFQYKRNARYAGETGYSYRKMIAFSLNAIFAFSSMPIKVVNYIGVATIFLSILGCLRLVILWIFYDEYDRYADGLIATMLVILFVAGVQLVSLGIIGSYIGRIFDQVKDRPTYIIAKRYNLDHSKEE